MLSVAWIKMLTAAALRRISGPPLMLPLPGVAPPASAG